MIDRKTNQAVPKKIFKIGGRQTNKISSAIVFGEHGRNDVPQKTVVRRNHLAPTFSVYWTTTVGRSMITIVNCKESPTVGTVGFIPPQNDSVAVMRSVPPRGSGWVS